MCNVVSRVELTEGAHIESTLPVLLAIATVLGLLSSLSRPERGIPAARWPDVPDLTVVVQLVEHQGQVPQQQ